MDIKEAISKVVAKKNLTEDGMSQIMQLIMNGEATDAQIAGFLIGLRMKGESEEEIIGAVKVMRALSEKVPVNLPQLVDTCGTGGDGLKTFNISTASAFVCAASGANVAKHGNRSISSSSGSADVLEKSGIRIDLTPEQVAECVKKIGIGFMFAPMHHSAMRHVISPRKEMGVRTIFNILGPMTNPAEVKNQVIGVFDRAWMLPMAKTLSHLGSRHVLLVNSEEGLDEVSVSGVTYVCEMKEGEIKTYEVTPDTFSLDSYPVDDLKVSTASQSFEVMQDVLSGENKGAARNIVLLNAGAAIYVSGVAGSWKGGIQKAKQAIENGQALKKLQSLAELSKEL